MKNSLFFQGRKNALFLPNQSIKVRIYGVNIVHFELKETHKYIYTLWEEKKHGWVGRVTKCCHTAELWEGQQRLPFAHIAEDFSFLFSLALHIRVTHFNMYQFRKKKEKMAKSTVYKVLQVSRHRNARALSVLLTFH